MVAVGWLANYFILLPTYFSDWLSRHLAVEVWSLVELYRVQQRGLCVCFNSLSFHWIHAIYKDVNELSSLLLHVRIWRIEHNLYHWVVIAVSEDLSDWYLCWHFFYFFSASSFDLSSETSTPSAHLLWIQVDRAWRAEELGNLLVQRRSRLIHQDYVRSLGPSSGNWCTNAGRFNQNHILNREQPSGHLSISCFYRPNLIHLLSMQLFL